MTAEPDDTKLLLAYLSEELDSDAIRRLETRLLEEEDLRRRLLELSVEEAVLTEWAQTERTVLAIDDQTFVNESVPTKARPSHFLPLPWLATAAAIVLAGTALFLIGGRNEKPRSLPVVARLVASVDAEWTESAADENESLPVGTYALSRGSIDLLFTDGASVSISAPAEFDLVSSRHLHLEAGNLVAKIPDEALGFIVTSPQSEVVDLGTEFGLAVNESGLTDVHVLDGLVEVLPRSKKMDTSGVMIKEGQARRFAGDELTNAPEIPVTSRATLLGNEQHADLGVEMLRGSVRIASGLRAADLERELEGPNWIDLIPEQRGVTLTEPLQVDIREPGSYRDFRYRSLTVPADTKVNSYLLHFRPRSQQSVRGVIRFHQPIVAVICGKRHLDESDDIFGIPSVAYSKSDSPRGLEPGPYFDAWVEKVGKLPKFEPDEVILSQDRHAISIDTAAYLEGGYYDQVRVLILAPDS